MAGSGDNWGQVKAAYSAMGTAGVIAAVAGGLCIVVIGASLFSFGRSLLGASVSPTAMGTNPKDTQDAHDVAFARYLAQWNGRSMLILPGAPKREDDHIALPPPGPPTPPALPREYGGRPIIAMVLDTIWLDDGTRMSVGDAAKDETQVVEVIAPWEAILKWKGVEFTVPLFTRDKLVIKAEEKPAEAPSPGDAKPEPQTTAATDAPAGPAKPEVTKSEPPKVADSKPAPAPSPGPKSDAAPGPAPATAPPGEPGPEPDSSDKETSKPPQGGNGGRSE